MALVPGIGSKFRVWTTDFVHFVGFWMWIKNLNSFEHGERYYFPCIHFLKCLQERKCHLSTDPSRYFPLLTARTIRIHCKSIERCDMQCMHPSTCVFKGNYCLGILLSKEFLFYSLNIFSLIECPPLYSMTKSPYIFWTSPDAKVPGKAKNSTLKILFCSWQRCLVADKCICICLLYNWNIAECDAKSKQPMKLLKFTYVNLYQYWF